MKQLPFYKTFEEKSKLFKSTKIDTWEQYQNFIEEQKTITGIYRGVSSATYKIYTSLQRQYITQNLKGRFELSDFINLIRTNPLLRNYFNYFKIIPSKLSIYSFLQHYGAPTPFLDFTTNYEKALYFAIERYTPKISNTESIEDYFCIFLIKEEDYDLIEIPKVIKSMQEIKRNFINAASGYGDYHEDLLTDLIDDLLSDNTCNVYLIKHYEEFVDIYNSYNNIRIIAQEGLFVHNDYLDLPLEEALKRFLENETTYSVSVLDEMENNPEVENLNIEYLASLKKNQTFHQRLNQNIIYSFEIKKSLIPKILETFSLTKKDIYPEPQEILKDIFEKSIK